MLLNWKIKGYLKILLKYKKSIRKIYLSESASEIEIYRTFMWAIVNRM